MSRIKIPFALFAILFSSLACVTILGEDLPETDIPKGIATGVPVIGGESPVFEGANACSSTTDQIMKTAYSDNYEDEEDVLDEEVYLVSYIVSGDEISEPSFEDVDADLVEKQNDLAAHQEVWKYFSALIPADQREMIAAYSIITDGRGGILAAVSQLQSNANRWDLQVDSADINDYYELTFTLVHEFGHLLTLGPNQVPPNLSVFNNPDDDNIYLKVVSACPQYFPGEGCANSDSYINIFYSQFWVNIHEEWNAINLKEDEDIYNQRLDDFYNKYQDQFVTDYAVTNPEEDMAESWAFFVLGSQPSGNTIAEEKVLFFYQYPELVELRGQILNNLCTSFPSENK